MLIVVMMGNWSDDSVCRVVHNVRLYSVLDTVVISGEDVCVVWCLALWFVCLFVFSVMWSELLMTSAISYPLWSSVYKCHKVECAFTSPVRTECGMFVIVVCLCLLFCSAWMCYLEEVYICLLL